MNNNNESKINYDNIINCIDSTSEDTIIVNKHNDKYMSLIYKLPINVSILVIKLITFIIGGIILMLSIPFAIVGSLISQISFILIGLDVVAVIAIIIGLAPFELLLIILMLMLLLIGVLGILFGESLGKMIAKLGEFIMSLGIKLSFIKISN